MKGLMSQSYQKIRTICILDATDNKYSLLKLPPQTCKHKKKAEYDICGNLNFFFYHLYFSLKYVTGGKMV